jgi:hypothetical protein
LVGDLVCGLVWFGLGWFGTVISSCFFVGYVRWKGGLVARIVVTDSSMWRK